MDNIQTGQATRRKRGSWEDEERNKEEQDSSGKTNEEQDSLEKNNEEQDTSSKPNPGVTFQSEPKSALQREASRRRYLVQRRAAKIEELKQEIEIYETKRLSAYEEKEYKKKKRTLEILLELDDAEPVQAYNMPASYIDDNGRLDAKRTNEALHAKSGYDESYVHPQKRNKYDNEWESKQLERAQQMVGAGDSIQVADNDNYEYVFDRSQHVDFGDIEVDDPGSDEVSEPSGVPDTILEVRKSLPVYRYRKEFLDLVEANQIIVVVGETGSGKTTQLPQYLHEAGYTLKDGKILKVGCTQPRRVAAMSVAKRVAEEMGARLGEEVGYSMRFEALTSEKTVLQYLTDGMLLREFMTDPELSSYSALMIDEAHERTISTEVILSLLKDITKVRKNLKVIVASATINAEKFSQFFDNAPIFNVPGRRFPVDIHFTKSPEANYIQAAMTTVFQIHTTQGPGDILVFLTGQDEIETMQESIDEACERLGSLIKKLIVCPIYANLPSELQSKIFEPTPPDCRKVVLATNIAETSITIDGISYVIDPGYVKENVFNPATGMESLVVVPCSRASANQRAGRAGRVGPGKCFRLYTKWSFDNELQLNPTPEILRADLTQIVLLLLSLGITDLVNFDFMDPPSSNALVKSLELLYALGALNSSGSLTKTGRLMAKFPISPKFTKSLITGSDLKVISQILSVVAILGESSNLFYRPKDKKEQADSRRESFAEPQGDHLMLLNLWNQWKDTGYSNQWCQDNFVQYKTLKRTKEVREQLERLCYHAGMFDESDEPVDLAPEEQTLRIQKAIVSGFFTNVARLSKMGDSFKTIKKNQTVSIHPSSVVYKLKPPPKLILYHELVLTSKEFMRNCMTIDDEWLREAAPHYYSSKELEMVAKKKK